VPRGAPPGRRPRRRQSRRVDVGAAHLPLKVATVVNLGGIADSEIPIDGILAIHFSAAAEVRIDPDQTRDDDR